MRLKEYFITLGFILASSLSLAQHDSLKKSHEQLVFEIDKLLESTRKVIEVDDKETKIKLQESILTLNRENCKKIRVLVEELRTTLYNEYQKIPEVLYQVEPYLVSLKKCVEALERLTSHTIYEEADRLAYESAFLFKELAKGNLFRILNSYRIKPVLFEVSFGFGYQTNPMYATFTDAYIGTEWRSETNSTTDFENSNTARNLLYRLSFNYRVGRNISLGIGFQSLPSGEINAWIFNDTLPAGLADQSSESYTASAFNVHGAYLLKKHKENKKGFEFGIGATVQVNNYTLKRKITHWNHEYSSTEYIFNNQGYPVDTIYIYTNYHEIKEQENAFHTLSFGANLSAKYFFSNKASINANISQFFDTGVDVQQMDFHSQSLPSYTLQLNSFVAGIGVGLHF